MRRLPLPSLALAPGLYRMVSRLEFPYGSRWVNEMAALAAGLGPKWRQLFFHCAHWSVFIIVCVKNKLTGYCIVYDEKAFKEG